MIEGIVVGLLLLISLFLAFINWKIYQVTLDMLEVTIDIYYKTINLLDYTKKTYEVLGGEEGLTMAGQGSKMEQVEKIQEVEDAK